MATYDQVMQALRNADASGNIADASRLAQIAASMKAAPAPQETTAAAPDMSPRDGPNLANPQDSGYLSGITEQARQGASLGLADEVGAAGAGTGGAIAAALMGRNPLAAFSKSYDRRLGEIRSGEDSFHAKNPIASTAAQLTGGLSTLGGAGKAVAASPTIVKAIGQSAKVGAGYGATAGFASGRDGLANRTGSAALGGTVGGLLGAAIPATGYVIGKGVQSLKNMAGLQNPEQQASMLLSRALDRDGAIGPIETGSSLMNKPVAMADLGGQNVQRLADQVNVQGGAGAQKLNSFLSERQANQSGRVINDVKASLSPSTDTYGLNEQLAKMKSASSPLWEKAMNRPPIWDDNLAKFAAEPAVKAGMVQGVKLARLDALAKGEPFDPHAYAVTSFNEAGDPVIGAVPTWRTWQAAKEGLDAQIADARGPLGQNTKMSNALKDVKNGLLKQLDMSNPAYAQARKAWAGPSAQQDAIALGKKALSLDPEQISGSVSKMAPDEQQAFRVGAARAIQDQVDRVKGEGDVTNRIFNNDRIKGQIKAAFGNAAYSRFEKAMEAERLMSKTSGFVRGNSRTAMRLLDSGDLAQQVTEDFMRGGKSGVLNGFINGAISRGRGINDATGSALSDMLTATTPDARASILKGLTARSGAAQNTQSGLLNAGALTSLLLTQQAASNLAFRK